jgi:glycosyltransferase involved in cell wall biosynthesis
MTTLSVVIPAYNEESSIAEIVTRVLAVQPALQEVGVSNLELIVVDDGSRDQTTEIIRQIGGVRLVRHTINQGYGAALKTGFSLASGELIGFLDADGTYPPEYLPQLCRLALDGAELVIGSRMAGARSQMPLMRRLGNMFFATLLTLFSHVRVTDSASGMRVFRREILNHIYPLPDGLNLTPVMSTRAIHEGIRVQETPIPYSERLGRSKLSIIRDGSIFLQSMIWTVLTYNPVRILGLFGLGGIGFTAVVGIWLIIARLMGITQLAPWGVAALFWAVVSAITGVNLFALGVTFNYLISLFYKQPIRQGLFGKPIFKQPLDRHFGWMGLLSIAGGMLIGIVTVILGLQGWDITRLWFYLLGSALVFVVGVQLFIYWILLRVLDEISQRAIQTDRDLHRTPEKLI